jgi:hypothetical protein
MRFSGIRYCCVHQEVGIIEAEALIQDFPELANQGIQVARTLDPSITKAIRWYEVRRRVSEIAAIANSLQERKLNDAERTAVIWYQAALVDGDPNVLISEWFNSSRAAAAQRLHRVRQLGLIPPTRHGQRKADPLTHLGSTIERSM